MSVITTVYKVLEADPRLRALLADSTIDPTKKAIYEEWADHEATMPYMNLTYSFAMGDHFAKDESLLNIDIFTESNTVQAEDIKEACIFALDRQTLVDETDGAFIRCYYNRDGIITEPTDGISHWNVEITLIHWRNNFIAHIE
jgi:hypothetical protein